MSNAWLAANGRYLEVELLRLRLLLRRRIAWLESARGDADRGAPGDAAALLVDEDLWARERLFHETAPEAKAIREALEKVHERLLGELRAMERNGQQPALATLVQLFGLRTFACDVVLLCAGPELSPDLLPLYAAAQGDPEKRYPTAQLALSLFAPEDAAIRREELMSHAPLRRYGLVTLDPARRQASFGGAPLRLAERALDYLLGANRVDERLAPWLHEVPAGFVLDEERARIDELRKALGEKRPAGTWPIINVVGQSPSGRRALAQAACEALGLDVYELDPGWFAASGERIDESVRAVEREALLLQSAIYLDRAALDLDEPTQRALALATERLHVMLFAGSREQLPTERASLPLWCSEYTFSHKLQIWGRALADVKHSVEDGLEPIVQQFDLEPPAVIEVVRAADARARVRGGDDPRVTFDDLWTTCRERSAIPMEALVRRIVPTQSWEDIVLPDDIASQLRDIAAQVEHRATVYERWGFGKGLGRGRGIAVLFAGQSGTGKTMAAEILGRHLGLDLFRIDLSGVVSKYIGETEKNLRRVFDAAEAGGALLFFDEADALFGKRSEVKDSHDRYANIEINYLLQRMEDYRGVAILATNMKASLDDAFLRRLRFVVDFPMPDASQRARIWRRVFPEQSLAEPLDFEALSRLELSGGNIKSIALNAAFLAAQDKDSLRMEHVRRAARREYAKLEKILTDPALK